jgi:hypothetical protein
MEVDEGQKGQGPFVVALVLVLNYPRAPRTQSARGPATFREPFLGQKVRMGPQLLDRMDWFTSQSFCFKVIRTSFQGASQAKPLVFVAGKDVTLFPPRVLRISPCSLVLAFRAPPKSLCPEVMLAARPTGSTLAGEIARSCRHDFGLNVSCSPAASSKYLLYFEWCP